MQNRSLNKFIADNWPLRRFFRRQFRRYQAWENDKVLRPCCNPSCWSRRPHWSCPDDNRGTQYVEVEHGIPSNRIFCCFTCACEGGAYNVNIGELHVGHNLMPQRCGEMNTMVSCMLYPYGCDHRSWCVQCDEPTRMLPD